MNKNLPKFPFGNEPQGMTVDMMIEALQKASADGYGSCAFGVIQPSVMTPGAQGDAAVLAVVEAGVFCGSTSTPGNDKVHNVAFVVSYLDGFIQHVAAHA
jgi:hypothetical protein